MGGPVSRRAAQLGPAGRAAASGASFGAPATPWTWSAHEEKHSVRVLQEEREKGGGMAQEMEVGEEGRRMDPGMHWKGGEVPPPRPLQGAQPTPGRCLPVGKCRLHRHS